VAARSDELLEHLPVDSALGPCWRYFSQSNATHDISRMNPWTAEIQALSHLTTPHFEELEGSAFLETSHGLTLEVRA